MNQDKKTASIGFEIDAKAGIESLDALASALGRVNAALDELKGKSFGSIKICVCGALATVEVADQPSAELTSHIDALVKDAVKQVLQTQTANNA